MKTQKSNSSAAPTSARKIAANRGNASRSTGPKSTGGKARSKLNALKYGFYAKAVLLPGEDPVAFEALGAELWRELAPQNGLEALCTRDIFYVTWRLQRLGFVEGEIFVRQSKSITGDPCGAGFAFVNDAGSSNTFSKFGRYEAELTRRLYKAVRELRLLREQGWKVLAPVDAGETGSNVASPPDPSVAHGAAACGTSGSVDQATSESSRGDCHEP